MDKIDDSILKMIESNTSTRVSSGKPKTVRMTGGIIPSFGVTPSGPFGFPTNPAPKDAKKSLEFSEQQKKQSQIEFNMAKSMGGTWKAIPKGHGNLIMPTLPH